MSDLWILVGRLHPVLVHFPLGLLVLGGVLRAWAAVRGQDGRAGSTMLLFGALGAVAACVAGFAYADDGQFRGSALAGVLDHRNAAIVATLCAIAAVVVDRLKSGPVAAIAALGFVTAGAVGYAGHLGGLSVHGEDHYTVGPRETEAPTAGAAPAAVVAVPAGQAIDFIRDVQPILENRCYRCHDKRKRKGGLRLDRKKYFLEGGDGGPSVVPGKPVASKLFQMINLPVDHEDYMPAKGDPIPQPEVDIIGRWIEEGAPWPDEG